MGSVMCLDPAYNSNSDIFPGTPILANVRDSIKFSALKGQKFRGTIEFLGINQLKHSSSERSSISSRFVLERATSADWRDSGNGSCWSASKTDSYNIFPMTKVYSNIWIGNEDNSDDEDLLIREGITHVLSLVGYQSSVGKVVRKQKVMHDGGRTNIKSVLDEVYEFMESGQEENNNLLVHCKLGQNRSAVVVIAFLMKKFKINLHRAHRHVKNARPIVQVNVDYAKQLLDLEQEYFGSNSLPRTWMQREYNEATNELAFKHENLSTERQKSIFANIEDK